MFSEKTIEFLKLNKLNNSKEWFNDHKDEYEMCIRDRASNVRIACSSQILILASLSP